MNLIKTLQTQFNMYQFIVFLVVKVTKNLLETINFGYD